MSRAFKNVIRLHPRAQIEYVSEGRVVMATDLSGFIFAGPQEGLWVWDTRMLSRYQYWIGGRRPTPIVISNVEQHTWLGYYAALPADVPRDPEDQGSGGMQEVSERTLELRVGRFLGDGMHEDLDLENFTQAKVRFTFGIELDADFADPHETEHQREQIGKLQRQWQDFDNKVWELNFDYRVSHHYSHQGNVGTAHLHRGLTVRVHNADTPARYRAGRIEFEVELEPLAKWHACLDFVPFLDGQTLEPAYDCYSYFAHDNEHGRLRRLFLQESTKFKAAGMDDLTHVVIGALEQAKEDLVHLRLFDLDQSARAWVPAAGLPLYIALFGRDTLTTAWQMSPVNPALLRGTLQELVKWQGTEQNDWRDEQPGRMLHEAHVGPLAMLRYNPRDRYFGAATTSVFYGFALSELWHWTGDKEVVAPLIDPALKALRWADEYARSERDGFYYYQTRSTQGTKNQGWKDSGDAIIYPDGRVVDDPIATCEEQAFVFITKLHLSELLWWFDRSEEARRLYREAEELKKRFNERFWMDNEGFFAMGLDGQGKQIRSIGSDPGHCVSSGIVDHDMVQRTADRLFAPDLFSGWGIRTLSADHVSYDPYSYHRGTVWPVEHGAFAIGFYRYGLHDHVEKLTRAQFELAQLFDFYRLPECCSGHPRDEKRPFPAIYPRANWPQAWSASAVFSMLQAILGVYAYAPLHTLLLDPHLPEWLPEITLRDICVGAGSADIRFYREADGHTEYEVLDTRGRVHVLRQPSPWSLTASFAERVRDAVVSLLPGK